MQINGTKVNEVKLLDARQKARNFLVSKTGQYKIFTPNPEMIVKAKNDEYFRKVLNSGDLNLCDGSGLYFVARAKGLILDRITGSDFIFDLCELAVDLDKSIFLLGTKEECILSRASLELLNKFPSLKISGFDKGMKIQELSNGSLDYEVSSNEIIIAKINACKPDILVVAFGMGKQEKWIDENLKKIPSVKVAIGVGGALDFIAKTASRAPKIFRKLGIEWLWRLFNEPKRIKRIFYATFGFVWLLLTERK